MDGFYFICVCLWNIYYSTRTWYVMDFYVDQSLPNENSLDSIRDPIIVNVL